MTSHLQQPWLPAVHHKSTMGALQHPKQPSRLLPCPFLAPIAVRRFGLTFCHSRFSKGTLPVLVPVLALPASGGHCKEIPDGETGLSGSGSCAAAATVAAATGAAATGAAATGACAISTAAALVAPVGVDVAP